MAKFVLDEGERVLEKANIVMRDRHQPKMMHETGQLILTDQRVVIVSGKHGVGSMFGLIGALFNKALNPSSMTHQIARTAFGEASTAGKTQLEVRSTGSGYAMQKFEVEVRDAETWADRLRGWAAGE